MNEKSTPELLHANEWVSLYEVNGYVYSYETRCQGKIVAVLPYRYIKPEDKYGRGRYEFLLRYEITPCWDSHRVASAITGGWEGGDVEDDAVREVLEETGYEIKRDELIPMGECYGTKSTNVVFSLFGVDLSGREPGQMTDAGSSGGDFASWVKTRSIFTIQDPIVSVMYTRMLGRVIGVMFD